MSIVWEVRDTVGLHNEVEEADGQAEVYPDSRQGPKPDHKEGAFGVTSPDTT